MIAISARLWPLLIAGPARIKKVSFATMESSLFNVIVPIKDDNLLIYNTLSLETELISRQIYTDIIKQKLGAFHPTVLSLIHCGMLTPCAKTQYQEVLMADNRMKKANPKIHLTIMMSEACNFSCDYCNQGQDKDNKILSKEVVEALLLYIKNTSCAGSAVDVSWFGGEPLLSLNELLAASNMINDTSKEIGAKYQARVITNGFLLTKKNAMKLHDSNIKMVQVSFDGDKESHDASRYAMKGKGTYDIILLNIQEVLESVPIHVCLRVNVSAKNVNKLQDLVNDLENRGFNRYPNFSVYWGHIYDPTKSDIDDALNIDNIILDHKTFGQAEMEMNRLLINKGFQAALTLVETKGRCIATQSNSFVVRPNGDLHKCYIPISNSANSCGSIFDVNQVFASANYQHWNNWTPFEEDNCGGCKLLGSCRGGCPINYISDAYKTQTYKCPPSKLFTNEYIFDRAVQNGLVSAEDWDELNSTTKLEDLRMAV